MYNIPYKSCTRTIGVWTQRPAALRDLFIILVCINIFFEDYHKYGTDRFTPQLFPLWLTFYHPSTCVLCYYMLHAEASNAADAVSLFNSMVSLLQFCFVAQSRHQSRSTNPSRAFALFLRSLQWSHWKALCRLITQRYQFEFLPGSDFTSSYSSSVASARTSLYGSVTSSILDTASRRSSCTRLVRIHTSCHKICQIVTQIMIGLSTHQPAGRLNLWEAYLPGLATARAMRE